jgi:predicted amidohydrolase
MAKLRVALAQTCPINAEVGSDNVSDPFSTIEQNLLDVKERVKTASEEGADVVVFPEYFLQGLVDQGRQVSLFQYTLVSQTDLSSTCVTRRDTWSPT